MIAFAIYLNIFENVRYAVISFLLRPHLFPDIGKTSIYIIVILSSNFTTDGHIILLPGRPKTSQFSDVTIYA